MLDFHSLGGGIDSIHWITMKRRRVNSPPWIFMPIVQSLLGRICIHRPLHQGDDIRRNPFVPAGMVTVVVVVAPPDGMPVCKALQDAGFRPGDSSTL